jgi:hypothetical protein
MHEDECDIVNLRLEACLAAVIARLLQQENSIQLDQFEQPYSTELPRIHVIFTLTLPSPLRSVKTTEKVRLVE